MDGLFNCVGQALESRQAQATTQQVQRSTDWKLTYLPVSLLSRSRQFGA